MLQLYLSSIQKYYLYILVFLLCISCSYYEEYQGKVFIIDFRNIEEIEDGEWIEIDDIRYTHYEDFQSAYSDSYSLPASKEVYYIIGPEGTRKERFTPVSNFTIAAALGNFVDLNHSKLDTSLARVNISQRHLVFTHGILFLQKPDTSSFMIRTSDDYPAVVKVKK